MQDLHHVARRRRVSARSASNSTAKTRPALPGFNLPAPGATLGRHYGAPNKCAAHYGAPNKCTALGDLSGPERPPEPRRGPERRRDRRKRGITIPPLAI